MGLSVKSSRLQVIVLLSRILSFLPLTEFINCALMSVRVFSLNKIEPLMLQSFSSSRNAKAKHGLLFIICMYNIPMCALFVFLCMHVCVSVHEVILYRTSL